MIAKFFLMNIRSVKKGLLLISLLALSQSVLAADKPNILVVWGDDIGT